MALAGGKRGLRGITPPLGRSLKVQLAVFLLLVMGGANLYLFLVWSPAQERISLETFRKNTLGHLITVGDALQPYLIQGQLGAVQEMLDALMERQPDWQTLELDDGDGRRVYPLFPAATGDAGQVFRFRHEIRLRGAALGTLRLVANAAPVFEEASRHNMQMGLFFSSAFAGAFVLVLLFLEVVVRRPVYQLARAAGRLAEGDYGADLPAARADEIGRLVVSFGEMRDTIHTRTKSLEEARRRAEEASRAKSRFLASMSHELRTPMNAILGYAQLLLTDEGLTREHREDVSEILISGRHLLELINDVLDLSKVEAGRLRLERLDFNLAELVGELGRTYGGEARRKGLELRVEQDPTLPEWRSGDPTRVRQVLINLLGNAIKFTEIGEVRLSVVAGEGDEVVFDVVDTGIGIDEESRARLFQPFTQADDSMTRRFGGTGLGLALSRRLVEAMGGALELESEPLRGSRFRVRVPLGRASGGTEVGVEPETRPATDLATRYQARVLLVEDNLINRRLAEGMLKRFGIEPDNAGDGQEALIALERSDYDLVLMDVQMPVMDGYEATRQLRERERRKGAERVPVIALTANAMAGDREDALAAGMDDYLSKPVRLEELEKLLADWLPREEGGGESPVAGYVEPQPAGPESA